MDYDRYSKWVKLSVGWIREESGTLFHHVQLLGLVDAELRGICKEHLFDEHNRPREDEDGILLLEKHQIKAHLWVLGVYEFTRLFSQRLRMNPSLVTNDAIARVNETKRLFERVRIPLAKLEASSRNKKTDFDIAYVGIGPQGLGWRVSEETVIYQEELSDVFFEMMCFVKRKQ